MKLESEFFTRAIDLGNLGILAPHKTKYYNCYNIDWLIETVKTGTHLKYVTFWHEGEEYPNHYFSQWYQGKPFSVNGRTYITAEQYNINSQVKMAFDTITAIGNKSIESLLHPFGESRSNQHFFDSSPKCWQLPN